MVLRVGISRALAACAALTMVLILVVPGSAHPVPSAPFGTEEHCNLDGGAGTTCSTGQHVLVFVPSHGFDRGEGSGVVRSILSMDGQVFAEKTCEVQGGRPTACFGYRVSVLPGQPFDHDCVIDSGDVVVDCYVQH